MVSLAIMEGISSGVVKDQYITYPIEIIKSERFSLFLIITVFVTVLFTYIIAKITLTPSKNALESQKRFISDIAHELRTPLSVIKTNSEVFLMDENLYPNLREIVKSNNEELDRISEIINNLLSLNKLIRPEKMKFSNVDIGLIIDSAVQKLNNLASSKNLEINIKKVSPHIVWGNAVALEQVITNLLKNAINYTGRNGVITIRVGPDYVGNIVIHIEDTGIGITKSDLLHIFEPFFRSERSRNRRHGSSGLGLTIASELVKIHSGRITIKSAENKGTVAIVTLPYRREMAEDPERIDLANLNEVSLSFLEKRRD